MKNKTKSKRRWTRLPRFGLRFLLMAMFVFACWIGWHVRRAENQRHAIEQIRDFGGWVHYDFEFQNGKPISSMPNAGFLPDGKSPVPDWLLRQLGHDFFHPVVELNLISDVRHRKTGQPTPVVEYFDTEWVACLKSFPRLKQLMIKGEQVDDHVLAAIAKLNSVEELHILGSNSTAFSSRDQIQYDTEVSNMGIKSLSGATSLKSVSISFCKLDDESLSHLAKLKNLESLSLTGGRFTDAGVKNLESAEQLSRLWLDDTLGVTDESINVLASLPNLRSLVIQNSLVTDIGVEQFNKLNPKCRFKNFSSRQANAK